MTRPPKKPARRVKRKERVIRKEGAFSVEAEAAGQAFFKHKREHGDTPADKLTPLQRRMMSGGA